MPVFPAIFERLAGNLLSEDGSATQLPANIAGNIARCGCPFKVSYRQGKHDLHKKVSIYNYMCE